MIVSENQTNPIDASCRVPLLVLFGGAAAWLVVSSLLALVASLTFHMPDEVWRLFVADLWSHPACRR